MGLPVAYKNKDEMEENELKNITRMARQVVAEVGNLKGDILKDMLNGKYDMTAQVQIAKVALLKGMAFQNETYENLVA
jgi:hypothetical protein